ncbi:hypothetical protein [Phenylobacterium sp. J367]|uniref:hypothetical protein n=1 Tax=Phenylobacterium sp. J367 TaxID=2898435 RepID=UPI002150E38A|nr:hypothetical protein [Phenylobacterium sp. J367]MCR5880729.1 hypothetical protein [Phenylobacterium sp. J367]
MLGVAWLAYKQFAVPGSDELPVRHVEGGASDAERATARALLADAYAVLRSPAFDRNLRALDRRYPEVYANRDLGDVPLSRVADWVSRQTWGARYASLGLELVGSDHDADPRREHASAGGYLGSGVYASMTLGRAHLTQYRSMDPVERSCAINVAAHELSHTISTTPFFFTNAFTDTRAHEPRIVNRDAGSVTPVGSYLIGAVAQCTWLEQQGRLRRGEFTGCLQVFGTRSMNWERCTAFADGAPVLLKPYLPSASSPL